MTNPEKICTPQRYLEIRREVNEEIQKQDDIFDEYLRIPDRPTVESMVAVSGSAPQSVRLVDMDHFHEWAKKRSRE